MPELVRFTNCLLATETGQLVKKDLWIDQERGIILDAQVVFKFTSIKYKVDQDV